MARDTERELGEPQVGLLVHWTVLEYFLLLLVRERKQQSTAPLSLRHMAQRVPTLFTLYIKHCGTVAELSHGLVCGRVDVISAEVRSRRIVQLAHVEYWRSTHATLVWAFESLVSNVDHVDTRIILFTINLQAHERRGRLFDALAVLASALQAPRVGFLHVEDLREVQLADAARLRHATRARLSQFQRLRWLFVSLIMECLLFLAGLLQYLGS